MFSGVATTLQTDMTSPKTDKRKKNPALISTSCPREKDKLLLFPGASLSVPVLNSMANKVKMALSRKGGGGRYSLLCHVEGFLPHSPQNGSDLKKRAGLPFIYWKLRMATIWVPWEPVYSSNFWLHTAAAAAATTQWTICWIYRFSIKIQPLDVDTWSDARDMEANYLWMKNLSCLFALSDWIPSQPGESYKADHIGDLTQQHCELCMPGAWVSNIQAC